MVLGVDPGNAGAAALLHCGPDRCPVLMHVTAVAGLDAEGLLKLAYQADLTVIEAQHAAPRQGARSAFTLGWGYGWIGGVLATVERQPVIVQPSAWRGAFGLGGGPPGKREGIALAEKLTGAPVLSHDEADAVLLAWWGWRRVIMCDSAEHGKKV